MTPAPFRLLVAFLALWAATAYETEGEVIVLTAEEFPTIIQEHPQLLIEFYAPWCGHCKKLAPLYTEAAEILASKKSPVKLAKIDDTTEKLEDKRFPLTGYPTLYFLDGNTVTLFDGERTANGIARWITKKVAPVTELKSKDEIEAAKKTSGVNIVLLSNQPAEVKKFRKLAQADLVNDYFVVVGDLVKDTTDTKVSVFTSHSDPVTYQGLINSEFRLWLLKNIRAPVSTFDETLSNLIFKEHMSTILLFNGRKDDSLTKLLRDTAPAFKTQDLLFSEIRPSDENHKNVAEFFGITGQTTQLIAVDGGVNAKAIYRESLSDSTPEDIKNFVVKFLDQAIALHPYNYSESEL